MPTEYITNVSPEKLKQLGYSKETGELQSSTTIYGHVNEHMEQNISSTLREIYDALISYNESEDLPNDVAIENIAKRFRKSIENAKKNKSMFSIPCHIDVFKKGEKLSIIEYSIMVLRHLMEYDANVTEIGRSKLQLIWLEMSDLVSKGNSVNKTAFQSGRLPYILQRHKDYLSNLKQIVCDSIESDKKDGVIVERDNAFYCVQCPEESVVTPAKFLSNSEFKDLEYGALKIGEGGDVIRIQNGQYCDMKGVLQMTFPVGEEKIEMILFSENTSGFGKITVHMDDKNREIFSKHLEELEKESRISKVVGAAKSFVQNKASPLSSMDDTNAQHLQSSGKELQA